MPWTCATELTFGASTFTAVDLVRHATVVGWRCHEAADMAAVDACAAGAACPVSVAVSTGLTPKAKVIVSTPAQRGEFAIPGNLQVLENDIITFSIPANNRQVIDSVKLVCGGAAREWAMLQRPAAMRACTCSVLGHGYAPLNCAPMANLHPTPCAMLPGRTAHQPCMHSLGKSAHCKSTSSLSAGIGKTP